MANDQSTNATDHHPKKRIFDESTQPPDSDLEKLSQNLHNTSLKDNMDKKKKAKQSRPGISSNLNRSSGKLSYN